MQLYPEDLDHSLRRGELSTLGVAWREIAGPLWRSPYRDVHVWSATDAAAPRQRALDVAGLLPPGAALGTWAAACLAGVTELDGGGSSGAEEEPVLVCLPPRLRIRRGAAIRCLRSQLSPEDLVLVDGVPVTTPVRTAFDLARTGTLVQAVVALDVLARGRPTFAEEVIGYAQSRRKWGGVPQVRCAARLASYRSRSAGETKLRLLWQLEARLGTPQVNANVLDTDGNLLAIADLLDDRLGLVGEYDGATHRDVRRHADDNAREEWLENAGLIVVRASAPDLGVHRRRTLARLDAASRRGRSRLSARRRWTWSPGPLPPPVPHW